MNSNQLWKNISLFPVPFTDFWFTIIYFIVSHKLSDKVLLNVQNHLLVPLSASFVQNMQKVFFFLHWGVRLKEDPTCFFVLAINCLHTSRVPDNTNYTSLSLPDLSQAATYISEMLEKEKTTTTEDLLIYLVVIVLKYKKCSHKSRACQTATSDTIKHHIHPIRNHTEVQCTSVSWVIYCYRDICCIATHIKALLTPVHARTHWLGHLGWPCPVL